MKNYFETDLEGIKNQLIIFLQTQDTFKDYNFDGAAINNLLNILAYVTQYQNLYLNFVSNELFLPTAELEDNVYKGSNTLNYIPKRKAASYIDVTLQRTESVNIIIPKYSIWTMGSLLLTNLEDISISDDLVHNVSLYEGTFITETFISDGTDFQLYELANRESIDDNNFFVYVDSPDGLGGFIASPDRWINANIEGFNTGDNAYYVQYFEKMSIKFDDGKLFAIPQQDDRVRVVYLNTLGADANGSNGTITLTDTNVTNRDKLNIVAASTLRNGVNEESVTSIKSRAPLFYTTQNRAVTERDYNILFSKYSYYDIFHSGIIWGGEKEFIDQSQQLQESTQIKDLGHIYISAIKSDYSYLDAGEISDIIDYLSKFKIITLFFKFMHPTFINIKPTVSIKYNSVLDLNLTSIEEQINEFLQDNDGYEKNFYLSDVIRFVDNLNDIVYCTVDYDTSITVYNEAHKVIRLMHAVVPGSVTGTVGGFTLEDNGIGGMTWDSVLIGDINYSTGFITLDQDFGVESYELDFEYVNKNALNFDRESFLKHNNITLTIL